MSSTERKGARGVLSWVVKVGLSVALLAWLFHKPGTQQAIEHLNAATVAWVGLAVLLYAGCQLLNTYKWWVLLHGVGHPLGYWLLVKITFIGMFANFFLPTSIGGDVLRVGLATSYGVPASTGALTVLLQRFTGSLALLVLGLLGLLAGSAAVEHHLGRALLAAAIVAAVGLVGLAALTWLEHRGSWGERLPGWLGRPLHRISDGLARLGGSPRVLVLVMLASAGFQLSMVALQSLLGHAAGIRVAAVHWFWLVPLMTIGEMVPLGLAGIGPREVAAEKLFISVGCPAGLGTLSSLLWQAMKILCSLPGGLLWLLPAPASPEEGQD